MYFMYQDLGSLRMRSIEGLGTRLNLVKGCHRHSRLLTTPYHTTRFSRQTRKMAELLLDPDIRKWVILPIVLITLMFGLLRHYITILLTNDNKKPKEEEVKDS